jgi:uncharacterized protein involved in response to NO
MGTMLVAVMTRATRGHTGRALEADRSTVAIYLLVSAAALARIGAAFSLAWTMPLLIASGAFWAAAFAGFAFVYAPMIFQPRRGP